MKFWQKVAIGGTVLAGLGGLVMYDRSQKFVPKPITTEAPKTESIAEKKEEIKPIPQVPGRDEPKAEPKVEVPKVETPKVEEPKDPPKPEDVIYTASAKVPFSDTATYSLAQEYLRVFIEYRKTAGKEAPDSKEAQSFYFSQLAGENKVVEMGELEAEVARLHKNVSQLREKTGNKHEELTMRKVTFSGEDTYQVSIELKLAPEQEKRVQQLVGKYNPGDAYLVYALKLNSADGKMTKENVDQLEELMQADYGGKK